MTLRAPARAPGAARARGGRGVTPRLRSAFTLIEVMVALAIMVALLAVGIPSLYALFDLEQRGAARNLAMTYQYLVTEAAMRNVTFRIAYNLDESTYLIEVGDPDTLVFSDPETRVAYEEAEERRLRFASRATEEAEASAAAQRFAGLSQPGFKDKVELPGGTRFGFVYTPQYDGPQAPDPEREEDDPPRIVYSYVFANGEAEYTVVRLVSESDPEDGYSVEVEPVSGNVRVDAELADIGASLAWLPDEPPDFQ